MRRHCLIGLLLLTACASPAKTACTAANSSELLDRTLERLEGDIGQVKDPTPADRVWITEMTEASMRAWHAQVDGDTATVCANLRKISDARGYDMF